MADTEVDWNELPKDLREAMLGYQDAANELLADLILNPEGWTEEERRELADEVRRRYADDIAMAQEWGDVDEEAPGG